MSPKPRRAHQEEIPLTTTAEAASMTPSTTATSSKSLSEVNKTEEHLKEVEVPEEDTNVIEIEESLEEAMERQGVLPEECIADGDLDKPAVQCTNITEPPTEEEPSVASQLMTSEAEGDNLSVEGMVMSEDEREGVCDAPSMELVRAAPYALFSCNRDLLYVTMVTNCSGHL